MHLIYFYKYIYLILGHGGKKKVRFEKSKKLLALSGPGWKLRVSGIATDDECWIHDFGIPNKLRNMMWIGKDEPRLEVLLTEFRSWKAMLTIYFNYSGALLVNLLSKGLTITAKYFSTIVLPQLIRNIQKERPKSGAKKICLLHNIASCHKTSTVAQYLQQQKIQVSPIFFCLYLWIGLN